MKESINYLIDDALNTALTICKNLSISLGKFLLKIYAFFIIAAIGISLYTHDANDFISIMKAAAGAAVKTFPQLAFISIVLFGLCFSARFLLCSLILVGRAMR